MKIKKTLHGWSITPDTNEEEKKLAILLNIIRKLFCKHIEAGA